MEKLLTIVIPSYNMEKYLPKCMESVLVEDRELLGLLDVIVVNDGSRDGTSAIGHRYAAMHPNSVRVVDKENGHHGSCVNCGLKMARGRFIRILDADDYFDREAFARYLRKLASISAVNGEIDAVVTPYKEVELDGSVGLTTKCALPEVEILDGECVPELARTACLPMLTYSTELLRGIGYHQTEGVAYSDMEWRFSPFAAVRRCVHVDETVYCYLVGREGQSTSKTEVLRNFDSFKELLRNMAQLYEIIKTDPRFDEAVLRERMVAFLRGVCTDAVFYLPLRSIRASMHEILASVRQCSSELESVALSTSVSRIFAFNYVKFIESHSTLSLPYAMVVKLYLMAVRRCLGIVNRAKRGR